MAELKQDEDTATMDDTIRDTLRELNTRIEPDEPAIGHEGGKPQIPDKAPDKAPEKEDRPRDETGKFAKKDSAAPETASQPTDQSEATAPEVAESPLVTTTGQPIDINRAPASWKPAAKAIWSSLPEAVKAEVYRREGDFLNGNKGLKENADFGQAIKATVEPYRMLIEAEGGTPERAIADTLRTAALFRVGTPQQKLQAIFALDQQFNAGLVAHFQNAVQQEVSRQTGQAPQAQQPFNPAQFQDPRVDQILGSLQAQERARAQQEESISNAATERFISAKDATGQALYPFVDNVLEDMTQRVSYLRKANPSMPHEEVLKQAYEAAVWANPETRAVLMSQQQAQQQTNVETLRKTEAAKRASRGNVPKRGALPAGEAVGTMDDTIRDTLRQLQG